MPSDKDWAISFTIMGVITVISVIAGWEAVKFVAMFLYHHMSFHWQ